MTKSQSNQAFNTASSQNAGYNANAQSTYGAENADIGEYKNALAKYAAENPYVQGGEFQTSQNQALADTSAAQAQGAGQALQAEQVRSGQNPAAAIAATEQMNENNTRNMMGAEASANTNRIGAEAGYNQGVLGATAVPAQMEQGMLGTETGAATGALNQETEASKTPSFWQELGQGVISAGSSFAGGMGAKLAGCWIAARLYNGWGDTRTIAVRMYLHYEFGRHWYGAPVIGLYQLAGEWIAGRVMPRSRLATRILRWLFDRALTRAELWLATSEGGTFWRRYQWLYHNRVRHTSGKPPDEWHHWAIERVGDGFTEVF